MKSKLSLELSTQSYNTNIQNCNDLASLENDTQTLVLLDSLSLCNLYYSELFLNVTMPKLDTSMVADKSTTQTPPQFPSPQMDTPEVAIWQSAPLSDQSKR